MQVILNYFQIIWAKEAHVLIDRLKYIKLKWYCHLRDWTNPGGHTKFNLQPMKWDGGKGRENNWGKLYKQQAINKKGYQKQQKFMIFFCENGECCWKIVLWLSFLLQKFIFMFIATFSRKNQLYIRKGICEHKI